MAIEVATVATVTAEVATTTAATTITAAATTAAATTMTAASASVAVAATARAALAAAAAATATTTAAAATTTKVTVSTAFECSVPLLPNVDHMLIMKLWTIRGTNCVWWGKKDNRRGRGAIRRGLLVKVDRAEGWEGEVANPYRGESRRLIYQNGIRSCPWRKLMPQERTT